MKAPDVSEECVIVFCEADIAEAVRQTRRRAQTLGFSLITANYIATAASELANNLFFHGGGGTFRVKSLERRPGVELETIDTGPGIADIDQAMQEGFSTAGGLGCGLPGVKRLMDELVIDSQVGVGTQVRARKWL